MPRLFIFRHAKSSWADLGQRDFDRPLANRGLKAAPLMGAYMANHSIKPDLILCSTSRRTRETLGLILPWLQGEARILMENGLYEMGDDTSLTERLRRLPSDLKRVMVIGHNPVMHDISMRLVADHGQQEDICRLRTKFPTGGLAEIDLADTPWAVLGPGCGALMRFIVPRDLDSTPTP